MTAAKKMMDQPEIDPMRPFLGHTMGPIEDLIYGHCIIINPLPVHHKVCSYNCRYCEYGVTKIKMNDVKNKIEFPAIQVIIEELRSLLAHSENIPEQIIISGHGEPTLHSGLADLIELILTTRDELCPSTKVGIQTNACHLDTRKLLRAINLLDFRYIKLDAGKDQTFKAIHDPLIRTNTAKVIGACKELKDCNILSVFIDGKINNIDKTDIEEWIEVVGMIRPKKVHLQTVLRTPAFADVIPVSEDQLEIIGTLLERRTQIAFSTYTKSIK